MKKKGRRPKKKKRKKGKGKIVAQRTKNVPFTRRDWLIVEFK